MDLKELILKEQNWLIFLLMISFLILISLNFILPPGKVKEKYDVRRGFYGLLLSSFGSIFFFRILFLTGNNITNWLIVAVLSFIFLYYGLPMLFGV